MKQRRKRRTSKDIEEAIIKSATELIAEGGFNNLTITGIIRKAEIEPLQFYKRYKGLDNFIDEYVKKFDYWFSNITKTDNKNIQISTEYNQILCSLLESLWDNKIMQELLRWEISTKNSLSRRTAQLREFYTLPLCKYFEKAFSDTDIDIVAISALIVGGIYYLILHNELSDFSSINLQREQDRERVIKAIKKISEILFNETPHHSIYKVAITMKKDGVPLEKIEEYTDIPLSIIKEL